MAKRYQDLHLLWQEQEREFSARAISEISEMLSAMNVKKGEYYEIKAPWTGKDSEIVSVRVEGPEEDRRLGCIYKNRLSAPMECNYTELFWAADTLTAIHHRIRTDYNKYIRLQKSL